MPTDRVAPNAVRRVFNAPPGTVPFARMLQAQNRIARIEPMDTFEPTAPTQPGSPSKGPGLLPKLGEFLPIKPEPMTRAIVDVRHQVNVPATGRVLDLYI